MPLLSQPGRLRPTAAGLLTALAARVAPEHLALARTGVGLTLAARPRLLPALLGIDSATSTRMGWSTQMLGAREIALGLGALAALRAPDRRASRLWLAAGALCDGTDALALGGAVVKNRVSRPTGGLMALSAVTAAAIGRRHLGEADETL